KLHLMNGPITVLDGGAYAGDARIGDLPPGGERLLSYALDADVEIAAVQRGPEKEASAWINRGALHTKSTVRERFEYTIKNSGGRVKQVVVEHPRRDDWSLAEPAKPAEVTRSYYRLSVAVKPGEAVTLPLVEQQAN